MRTYTVIVVNPLDKCDRDDRPAGTLYQYDYGQRLVFGGVDLPEAYEVHFSNQKMGNSVTVIGDVTGVDIPDAMLLTGQDVHVWLYLHQGETDGETVYYARIAVKTRAKPTHEEPTPVQQDEITQAIAALNAAVDSTEADAAAAEASASAASAAQAAAEAAQDGAESAMNAALAAQTGAETAEEAAEDAQAAAERARDEITGMTAEATTLDPGESATASYEDGVLTIGVPRGADGQDGDPGADGYSPSASVSKSGTTATITITDKNGTTTATVSDGEDGYTPQRGVDYWTADDQAVIISAVEAEVEPEISEVKSAIDSKAPVILRDASGDIVTISDGADGMPLSSCVVTVDASETGRTGATVTRTGRNMLPTAGYTDVTRNSLANTFCKELNAVMAGKSDSFVISGVSTAVQSDSNTISINVQYTDETSSSTIIYRGDGHTYGPTTGPWTIVLDTGKTIDSVLMGGNTGAAKLTLSSLQLEHGAVGHAYEPYSGTAYSVSWQTEAGTVYDAAELDMIAGTLTVGQDVYQLTDVPTVETAKGHNSIYADCGGISLTYPADTQTYVDSAISAATDPDGNVVQVTGSTPSITGESGKRYVCGTVDSISITPPQTGIIDVVFTSGTTAALLTVPSGVRFPAWFNSASLDASTVYEINIADGINGAVMAWPI